MGLDSCQQAGQVLSCELPLEGLSHFLVMLLEPKETIFKLSKRCEVIGREDLSLHDGEVHFHLIKPTGMNRRVHGDDSRPASLESFGTFPAAVRGTVVHDPENTPCGGVRLLAHHLAHQSFKWGDACFPLAATVDLGSADVPSRKIRPRPLAFVLVLDSHRLARPRWQSGVDATASLDACFLVRRDHEVPGCQRAALPDALVQVQNPSRPFLKGRVARENPAPVTPRANGVFGQPTPKCGLADGCDKPAAQDLSSEFGDAEAGQGKPGIARRFARQGFNGDDHAGGESGRAVRLGTVLPVRRGVFRRNACATWRRSVGACPSARRSRHCASPPRRRGRSWRGEHLDTVTYIVAREL